VRMRIMYFLGSSYSSLELCLCGLRDFCGVSFSVCTEESKKYECFAGYHCRDVDVTVEILSALRLLFGNDFH